MHAGDRLSVTCGTTRWVGTAVAVSDDHVELVLDASRVVVNLDGPITVGRSAATSGGTTGDRGHRSLRARLSTIELTGDPVEVVTQSGTIPGRLTVVAADHVVVDREDGETWVPLRELGAVVLG